MKQIPLTKEKFALVDDEDYKMLICNKWQAKETRKIWYAARSIRQENGKQKTVGMHRLITNCADGYEVDHIDGNGLNNQRSNLRVVTRRQNHHNLHRSSSSKYPGVCWDNDCLKWQASIRIGKKIKKLGRYLIEEDAFCAYKNAIGELGDSVLMTASI